MKDFLEERLHELRRRYKDSRDMRWLHRYNEAKLIQERIVVNQIVRDEASGLVERRTVLSPASDKHGSSGNGGLT